MLVGNKHQRLCPETRAFHALVPSGSMWIPVPDRGGPRTNHLQIIRYSDPYWNTDISKAFHTGKGASFSRPQTETNPLESRTALCSGQEVCAFSDAKQTEDRQLKVSNLNDWIPIHLKPLQNCSRTNTWVNRRCFFRCIVGSISFSASLSSLRRLPRFWNTCCGIFSPISSKNVKVYTKKLTSVCRFKLNQICKSCMCADIAQIRKTKCITYYIGLLIVSLISYWWKSF